MSFSSMKRVGGSNNLRSQSVEHIGPVPEYCISMKRTWRTAWIRADSHLVHHMRNKKWAKNLCVLSRTQKCWLQRHFVWLYKHGGLMGILIVNLYYILIDCEYNSIKTHQKTAIPSEYLTKLWSILLGLKALITPTIGNTFNTRECMVEVFMGPTFWTWSQT